MKNSTWLIEKFSETPQGPIHLLKRDQRISPYAVRIEFMCMRYVFRPINNALRRRTLDRVVETIDFVTCGGCQSLLASSETGNESHTGLS